MVVIYFYFPETRGKTLEEASLVGNKWYLSLTALQIAVIFDGEAAVESELPAVTAMDTEGKTHLESLQEDTVHDKV